MNDLKPIRMLPAREQVASALRKAILSREVKEGEELTLEGTALQLGVSATPVREAFQILSRDGLIKLRPNKGAVVLGINEKTIQDHYKTRALLEAEAAALVCQNNADLEAIQNAYSLAEQALKEHKTAEYGGFNQSFHMEIWTAGGNDKIKSLLSSLWNGLSMGFRETEEDYSKVSISEHKQILDALMERDDIKARKRMNDHIIRSMNNILTNFNN